MNILPRAAVEAKKYKWTLTLAAVSTLALTGLNLAAPRIMSDITELIARGLDRNALNRVLTMTAVLLLIYLLRVLFRFLGNYMAHKAAWALVRDLRVKVYDKLQSLSMDYYRDRETGDLMSRAINDTANFEQFYAHLLPESVTNIITAAGVTVILLSINPKLALLTCLPIPLILISARLFATRIRPNFREAQKTLGKLSALLQDNFSGMQEIQAFGRQSAAAEGIGKRAGDYTRAILRALKLSAVFHPGVEFLTALGGVFVVGFGGYLAYLGHMSVGDIVAFLLYLTLFYAPVTGLANLLEQMQQALAGAERVFETLDTPATVANKPGAKALKAPRGEICFEHVSFAYSSGVPVLEDVSFKVAPGEMVAVVGATGVGKSTLARLAARFYDPVSGAVKMDGVDMRDIDLDSLRQNVSMVLQDTFLFNATIAENIAFARPGAATAEIERAARAARIHEDIMEMPQGYDTQVGERGARLSGGQKQRLAIARAIIREAPVLILDEATASVDVQTEAGIQSSIAELAGTRTIIIIAHRMSTVRNADRILVFENGRIVQQGSHDELAAVPGLYQTLAGNARAL